MSRTERTLFEGIKDTDSRRLERLADLLLKEAETGVDIDEDLATLATEPEPVMPGFYGDEPQPTIASADVLGKGFDWADVAAAGIHWEHGNRVRLSGDGYYNPFGSGAHISSTVGGTLKAGNDIASYEG